MKDYAILYKNHKRSIGMWEIWIENDNTLVWDYATGIGHSKQRATEVIKTGKQGRSIYEQAQFRLRSKVKNKIDGGYVQTEEEARKPPTDASGNQKPMLANKFRDFKGKIDPNETYVQLKFNGHRVLIFDQNMETVAISRNGKRIPGIDHILKNIHLPPGVIIDGEMYHHGWPLQKISSCIKKNQEESKQLELICFDLITDEIFPVRFAKLQKLVQDNNWPSVRVAITKKLNKIANLNETLKQSIKMGYEGLILRTGDTPYEAGRRSKSLLKLKMLQDDEFEIIDVLESKDNWGILVCQLSNGSTFKVSAPGTITDKKIALRDKDLIIGQRVTVEYSELTRDDVPFHPVALQIREDL